MAAPVPQPQSLTLDFTKPNLTMSGATSVTSTSFFSSVTAGEGSVSKGRSLVSAGKPPLSGHKRKPCAGAHSEANTTGSRCHCSKRRKNRVKTTVRVPAVSAKIADIPPDEYSWRKYGQKPIKGSPYPRGYYRCSSSKGCPARKQVERSRTDPTVLLVTYSYDHNHPWPAPKAGCHPTKSSSHRLVDPKPEPGTPVDCQPEHGPEAPEQGQEEEHEQKPVIGLADAAAITPVTAAAEEEEESFDFGWFEQYPTWPRTALYVPAFDVAPPEDWERELQGEDALFAGLGELPECAIVFGRRRELALPATAPCS